MKFLFPWTLISFKFLLSLWKMAADMNFRGFMEATIYETLIMLTLLVSWRQQNKNMFVYVNAQIFWFIDKLLLILISRSLMTSTTLRDGIIRIIKFLFVWLLNGYVYLIYCCHMNFEIFVKATIYELIIMYSHVDKTLMTIIIKMYYQKSFNSLKTQKFLPWSFEMVHFQWNLGCLNLLMTLCWERRNVTSAIDLELSIENVKAQRSL